METQAISNWIFSTFNRHAKHISKIALYGSVIRNSDAPNDCDLLIVSSAGIESKSWLSLRQHINAVKTDFAENFKLPLNVALLTEGV